MRIFCRVKWCWREKLLFVVLEDLFCLFSEIISVKAVLFTSQFNKVPKIVNFQTNRKMNALKQVLFNVLWHAADFFVETIPRSLHIGSGLSESLFRCVWYNILNRDCCLCYVPVNSVFRAHHSCTLSRSAEKFLKAYWYTIKKLLSFLLFQQILE